MLSWPDRARAAIRRLFEPLQDIDVYVEDTGDEAFYRCLLNRATQGQVTIARVFGLGGRSAVLRAATAHDHRARPAVYIVDGDLAWVRGDPLPHVFGLHCHDAYCVENLLISESALSAILSQELVVTEDEARQRLEFGRWRGSVEDPLVELFAAFGALSVHDPTVETVSQGVGMMCIQRRSPTKTELDAAKVRAARDRALQAAEAKSNPHTVSTLYNVILSRIRRMPDPLRAVSGKDFLLPLIQFHLQTYGCRIKNRSLRFRLAGCGDVNRFRHLASALALAARGYP